MAKANRPWNEGVRDVILREASDGLKLATALGMFAGMRIGDAVRVTRSIDDGANLEWRQGKTGDSVWLPAHRDLRALLDAAPRAAAAMLTGAARRPLKEAGLAKAFRV